MTRRLCLLDDDRLQLHPISIRFWCLFILALVLGVVLAVSAGAWYVVRQDYIAYSSTLTQVLEQRDNLMRVCVALDEKAKTKTAAKKTVLGIGGEAR
jgi:hypothetical protein